MLFEAAITYCLFTGDPPINETHCTTITALVRPAPIPLDECMLAIAEAGAEFDQANPAYHIRDFHCGPQRTES